MPTKDFKKLKGIVDLANKIEDQVGDSISIPENDMTSGVEKFDTLSDIKLKIPEVENETDLGSKFGGYLDQDEEPLSKNDEEEIRREVLERIRNSKSQNQQLNFRGGLLEKEGIYE